MPTAARIPAAKRLPRLLFSAPVGLIKITSVRVALISSPSGQGSVDIGSVRERVPEDDVSRNESNPWRRIASREVYENAWIRLREDQVVRPDGQPGIYAVVEMTAAVAVVALSSDERVYLVGQYRYPTDCYSWEIIAGYCLSGEDPLTAARRELLEETGLTAEEWTPLGDCQISNSVTNQIGRIFLARGLSQGDANPDDTEKLQVRLVSLDKAIQFAGPGGGITQAFSVVGLYRAWHHLHRGH